LIGECDGAVKYANANAYVLEKEREQILRDLGYRFVRWQAKEIMTNPAEVVARVARALGC
jgi:very-short-patch-repair endonuclease